MGIKHGFCTRAARQPEHRSYTNARQRCRNPKNTHYAEYGARGIEFRFNTFREFLAAVGPRPEPKRLYSLNRINNDGHYEVGNLKWSTRREQALNQRVRKDNASGHRGVCWHKRSNKWMAELMLNGKRLYLGTFATLEEAKAVRDKAVKGT